MTDKNSCRNFLSIMITGITIEITIERECCTADVFTRGVRGPKNRNGGRLQ